MINRGNPWDSPGWRAIGREARLVRQLMGSGVTALGQANYADKMGEYYTAFFGLSVGLERLAKLILVADFAISNRGQMPGDKVLRTYGHKLGSLLQRSEEIANRHKLSLRFSRPTTKISQKILECLDHFADARRGRYANLASLGDLNLGPDDPIKKWWDEVAESILESHYYGQRAQMKVEQNAEIVARMMGGHAFVLFTSESGDQINDLRTASVRTGQTSIVRRYGRFYTLTIIRWLSDVFSELSQIADSKGVDAFSGVYEFFWTYTVEDRFLLTRKRWPLH